MYETSAKKKVHSQTMEHKIERQSRFGFQLRNPPIFFEPPISRCLSSRTPPLRGPDNCFHQRGPYRQLQSDWLFFLVLCYMPTCSISWRVCVSAYVPGRRSSRARNENSETFPWAHQVEPEHSPPPGSAGGRLTPTVSWKSFQSAGIPKRPVGPILIFFWEIFRQQQFPR